MPVYGDKNWWKTHSSMYPVKIPYIDHPLNNSRWDVEKQVWIYPDGREVLPYYKRDMKAEANTHKRGSELWNT